MLDKVRWTCPAGGHGPFHARVCPFCHTLGKQRGTTGEWHCSAARCGETFFVKQCPCGRAFATWQHRERRWVCELDGMKSQGDG